MVRLLRNHDAYEANQFEENNAFLVAASIFPYFYALVGERNPKQAPQPKPRSEYSQLACDAFELIRRAGPDLEAADARRPGRKHFICRARPCPGRTLVEVAHHAGGLQAGGGRVLGRALPLGAGRGPRRHGPVGRRSAVGAALQVSGLRHRRRPAGSGIILRQFCPALPGQGSDQRTAGGAGTGFHPGGQPLPDPAGTTQGPGDQQEPCRDGHSCPSKNCPAGSAPKPGSYGFHGSDRVQTRRSASNPWCSEQPRPISRRLRSSPRLS